MENLYQQHCFAVTGDTPRLLPNQAAKFRSDLPDWCIYEEEGEPRLEKVFKFANFNQSMDFTNKVAQAANSEDHHPAILTEYGRVTVTWWTHLVKGLTLNDFIMAAKTDRIAQ